MAEDEPVSYHQQMGHMGPGCVIGDPPGELEEGL